MTYQTTMRSNRRVSRVAEVLLALACSAHAFAQAPVIAQGGVLNAASWSSPVSPGSIIAIFGANLAASPQSASLPWPVTLGGTSVTINGVPAPLAFVSPTQINAQVPSSLPLPAANSSLAAANVIVTTAAGTSTSTPVAFAAGGPGLFSTGGSGCGQAAALNVHPDGTVELNSPASSAAPGDYVSLFGTGFGLAAQQPPDGAAAAGAAPLQLLPTLLIDSNPVPGLSYAGLAPTLAGVDQINFQVPASTRNGCSVPVSAVQTFGSPSVTISVQSGRGPCVDPPIQSWGQLSLTKSVSSGPGNSTTTFEAFGASFPAGPAVHPPAAEAIVFAPDYVANVTPSGAFAIISSVPISFHACAVPGYSDLSAGAIQIQPQSGSAVLAQPLPLTTGGVTYSQTLPAGFIAPGIYTVSGTPGSPVGLTANLVAGSPIQLQTAFPSGTVISSSQPLSITWTGGDPGTLVKLTLISGQGLDARSSYSYANAATGSLTIPPLCTGNPTPAGNGVVCSFGVPPGPSAQITVQVVPAPDHVVTATVPGVTGPVQLNWQYSYTFFGLTLQ